MSHFPLLIISRSQPASPERTIFENTLHEKLQAANIPVCLLPDLSLLRKGSDALTFLQQANGPIIFLNWLQPRATYWWLAFLEVPGKMASAVPDEAPAFPQDRAILPFNLAALDSPEQWVEKALALVDKNPKNFLEVSRRFPLPIGERWYPVIDRSRCVNCLQCLEFCIFGVYDRNADGNLVVKSPDSCKPGCPACSRVCPQQAIMFPLHPDDLGIAGADGVAIQPFDPAQANQLRAEYQQGKTSVEDIVRACGCASGESGCGCKADDGACGCQAEESSDCGCDCACHAEKRDYLDDLIDELGNE
ncbi:TPA: hypothetical protein DDW35_13135 [Candidatus Sumerlaeota bacterium]|jgi:NAD-dependent dihydropyrimidine dehydrogenase PreA subunit|nr:hypothetical protein [Candidatus Sumerlaeota bacterium]